STGASMQRWLARPGTRDFLIKEDYQSCFAKRRLILPRGAKQRISIRNYGGGILSVLITIHSC
ncbi:hypothetical protein, partial [Mucilaginibacter sp.]|uniref:hypothetical protein n=1 Tax=Mucilaginibacter sp. TaxID=1882438 RepID=UPI002ED638F9